MKRFFLESYLIRNMRRIKIAGFLSFILLVFICFFYLYNVSIYEPVSIEISGIKPIESKLIKIYGISPFNRRTLMPYNDLKNNWFTSESWYLKSVEIVIPVTMLKKVETISITINKAVFLYSINELKKIDKFNGEYKIFLPDKAQSEKSLRKKISSMLFRSAILPFLNFFLTITIFVILLLCFYNIKNGKLSKEKILYWFKLIGVSVILALSIFYGYLLFKYSITSYITSILTIIISGIIIWLIVKFFISVFSISQINSKRINKAIFIFLGFWFIIEMIFRIIGFEDSLNEEKGLYYASGFRENNPVNNQNPHLLTEQKNYSFDYVTKEFAYTIKSNSEGLRDIEHNIEKEKNEYRIICVGNSFTEGIGAPGDSTWPKLLEDKLALLSKRKISVFNAGKVTSDPFFEYMLLKERMLKYNPDLVLLSLGSSDLLFYYFRGGFERFTADGFHYRNAPKWEKLYAVSYIFRFFIDVVLGYNYFLSPKEYKREKIKALNDIENCIRKFYSLSLENKFKLAIVFYDDNQEDYKSLIYKLKQEKTIPIIDLFDYNKNIRKLNQENRKEYFWPIDGHCNSSGYNLFSDGVLWNLEKLRIVDSLNEYYSK